MKKIAAILVLASLGITTATAGVRVGVHLGVPVPLPVPVVVARAPVILPARVPAPRVELAPVCPGPGYVWVGGSWGWCKHRWVWTRGHWNPPVHHGHASRPAHPGGFRGGHHRGPGPR